MKGSHYRAPLPVSHMVPGLLFQCQGWMAGNGASEVIWSQCAARITHHIKKMCHMLIFLINLEPSVKVWGRHGESVFETIWLFYFWLYKHSQEKGTCTDQTNQSMRGSSSLIKWRRLKSHDHFHALIPFVPSFGTPTPSAPEKNPISAFALWKLFKWAELRHHIYFTAPLEVTAVMCM